MQIGKDEIKERVTNLIKSMLSSEIGLPVEKIDPRVLIENYGINSIMLMKFTNELEQKFGSLSKTILFEYETIQALSNYLCEHRLEKVCEVLNINQEPQPQKVIQKEKDNKNTVPKNRVAQFILKNEPVVAPVSLKQPISPTDGWDIAIIGLAGQYPHSENVDELWENLKNGVDCISEIPDDRWDHSKYYSIDKTERNRTYAKWGGFLENMDCFDPLFFHISPLEAEAMDPQERLFLQCVYHAIQDAGYTADNLAKNECFGMNNNVGVYVGVMYEEYQMYGAQAQDRGQLYSLNGSEASIANRVSYMYGFHGPSMSVDSMCSSSLTALYLACKSIVDQECEVAVAGGVNLSLHPNKFIMLGQSRFAADDGRCRTFGEGGSGYVPGEGVGAVILKPLKKAIEDGDHIYGVVKGAALNHGGKSSGYTVPSPAAQTSVILQAWKQAGVNPKAISYIEAHGTGTSLGDPIEIAALKHAFEGKVDQKQFCNIGSIKSNIGHCESAAGIAGLTKVLLQMKHKTIVQSLNSTTLNKKIDFEDGPFIVPQQVTEWKQPHLNENGKQVTYPRIAGISAFGAGGTNAHVVIEEYIPKSQSNHIETQNHIPMIAISAKTDNQIKEQAANLIKWLKANDSVSMQDLAYTLLVGRESMERRVMILATTMDELKHQLELIAKGDFSSVPHTTMENTDSILGVFDSDDEMEELLTKWIVERGKYTKISKLWVNGLNIQWSHVLGDIKCKRLSLPGYPFIKEHYFAPKNADEQMFASANGVTKSLYPLIQSNTSDFNGQRYTSTFDGTEPFFTDHVVGNNKMLPAVVFMEMVYEGLLDAFHVTSDENLNVQFTDVMWIRPCIIEEEPVQLHVGYLIEDDNKINFEIYRDAENTEENYTYCIGTIMLDTELEDKVYDLQEIKEKNQIASVTGEKVYRQFDNLGLHYGSSQKAIKTLYHGEDSVLAQLELSDLVLKQMKGYTLYPAMLDSAIQACIGFTNEFSIFNESEAKKYNGDSHSIPFAVGAVNIYSICQEQMWAYLKINREDQKESDISIYLCNDAGNVCVSLEHLIFRNTKNAVANQQVVNFQPKKVQLVEVLNETRIERKNLILCNIAAPIKQEITFLSLWNQVYELTAEQDDIAQRFQHLAGQLFENLKQDVLNKQGEQLFVQVVVPSDDSNYLLKGFSGLVKTVHLEKPQITCQLISIPLSEDASSIRDYIKQAENHSEEPIIICQDGKLYGERFEKMDLADNKKELPFQDSMVYLITGGLGRLGMIMSKEIVMNTKDSVIILTGRSVLQQEKVQLLEEVRQLGATCEYCQLDVADKLAVKNVVSEIINQYQRLDGIIHCAGVTKDSFIYKKETADFMSILEPKVSGTCNLDEATKDIDLKLFLLFSSLSAVTGNVGQADYAAGNAFMDSFAEYRNQLVSKGTRKGKTISYNWPYWKDGGMLLDTSSIDFIHNRYGLETLDTENALKAFYSTYSEKVGQVVVVQGDEQKLTAMFERASVQSKNDTVTKSVAVTNIKVKNPSESLTEEQLTKDIKNYLIQIFSETLKISSNKIDVDSYFDAYGVDSIFTMRITEELEKVFGALSKTLLFERQTINELADYFVKNHKDELEKMFQREGTIEIEDTESEEKTVSVTEPKRFNKRNVLQHRVLNNKLFEKKENDIAIIGIAGKYPQAKNITEFWNNICDGKDCITEIPIERWDYRDYYGEDKTKAGKAYSKWGGFLDDYDTFDPLFFHIPPIEAKFIDPQERLFVQTVWEAMEDAGYTRKGLADEKVGVFAGIMYSLYQLYQMNTPDGALAGSASFASLANRISYLFDFNGPSIALDTMCSSSLTTVYLACESIKSGASTIAVAGGVNLSIHPQKYIQLCQSGFLSTDGRCRSFGMGGDGYVPGEGVGVVILKSLDKAIQDNDHIYGVIKGAAINSGGKVSGYTVPNQKAQRTLITDTIKQANIDPRTISYVEAHGTGTALGDPIEINAITQGYRNYTNDCQYCSIGSVKSNIGHLESAAGVAALTKVLLQIKHKKLVPSLHSKQLNPYINFVETPFYVQQDLEEWKQPVIDGKTYPRRAAISAFGAGGSNAHIIIEEFESKNNTEYRPCEEQQLFVLSATDKKQLKLYAKKLYDFIQSKFVKTKQMEKTQDIIDIKLLKEMLSEILNVSFNQFDDYEEFENFGMDAYQYEKFRTTIFDRTEHEISTVQMMQCKNLTDVWNLLNPKLVEQEKEEPITISLKDIAFTLQVGREAMQQRMVVFASDYQELLNGLEMYLAGVIDDKRYRTSNIVENEERFHTMGGNDGIKKYLAELVNDGNQKEIVEYWLLGAQIDWSELYKNNGGNRVSLPTYPFRNERYLLQMGMVSSLQHEHQTKPVLSKSVSQQKVETTIHYDKQANVCDTELQTIMEDYLKRVLEEILCIPYEHISSLSDYESYGIDSIHIKNITQYLEQAFGKLPSTLFFTYKNLRMLAEYFVREQKDNVLRVLNRTNDTNVLVTESITQKEVVPNRNGVESNNTLSHIPNDYSSDIAIIGISGKFPKADGLDEYLRNLEEGRDCISQIPKDRWNYEDYPEIICSWGGFMDDIEDFDPQFFGISPANAVFMDPQERLFTQQVWRCLEDAGYTPEHMESNDPRDTRAKVSVYAGVTFNEYALYGGADIARGKNLPINSQIYSIANRVSYLFNFGGPSLSVDTACSSSLYSVHLACESILKGECEMAIAGGVNLSLHPSKYITLNWAKFLASDGHCHSFGDGGDGYVPGEGVGAVLLKPLWKAEKDKDHIYGVIKGSAVNHGGKTYGYSVPNPVAQTKVIDETLQKTGIDPRTISYVEAHGTGTSLGDPIEITALSEAYRKYTNDKQYCAIGSVKSNIGHLEAAAGISQLLKVVLQLDKKELFQSRLNSDHLNPNIDFESTPFYVQQKNEEWKRPVLTETGEEVPRRAAISAFGVGGVNVHMIVEEYEGSEKSTDKDDNMATNEKVYIPLSAKSDKVLKDYVSKWIDFIEQVVNSGDDSYNIRDVAYTMQNGRVDLSYRVAFVVKNFEELKDLMEKYLANESNDNTYYGKVLPTQTYSENAVQITEIDPVKCRAYEWANFRIKNEQMVITEMLRKKVSLPGYPFEKEKYWLYSRDAKDKTRVVSEQKEEEAVQVNSIIEQLREAFEDERLSIVIDRIQDMFADILCYTDGRKPDIEAGFFSLGLESVASRQAQLMLEEEFNIELSEQIFFNYPNINEVSKYILSLIDFDSQQGKQNNQQNELGEGLLFGHHWVATESLPKVRSVGNNKYLFIGMNSEITMAISSMASKTAKKNLKFLEWNDDVIQALSKMVKYPDYIVFLAPEEANDSTIDDRMNKSIQKMFEILKYVSSQSKKACSVMYIYKHENTLSYAEHAALGGFFKSLHVESSLINFKMLRVESADVDTFGNTIIQELRAECNGEEIAYQQGRRHQKRLYEIVEEENESLFREQGVYLITGGFGGTASMIANYLARTYNAKLILTSRRDLGENEIFKLNEIEKAGGKAFFVKADISNQADVNALVEKAVERFGLINGVLHTAGVIKDAMLVNKEIQDFNKVLMPKVYGTQYLDEALKDMKLDFFVMFSSLSSVIGNIGQTDYCYANNFMDEFASIRNQLCEQGLRSGKTYSINWSFWENGGMKIDADTQKWMDKKLGLLLMSEERGISILERAMRAKASQVVVMNGRSEKIRTIFHVEETVTENYNQEIPEEKPAMPKNAKNFNTGSLLHQEELPSEYEEMDENTLLELLDSVLIKDI